MTLFWHTHARLNTAELPDRRVVLNFVLDDRPADSVPDAWQRQVVDAVTDRGMGLVMAGGGGSFGPGGWHETTIAAALMGIQAVKGVETSCHSQPTWAQRSIMAARPGQVLS